jgi:hypothetical protein
MIRTYCHDQHGTTSELCSECSAIRDYALMRLAHCPFQDGKTTCAKCAVHCYKPQMREQIRRVMRYAGPRMVWRHPIMAVQHLLDGRRNESVITTNRQCV